MFKFDKYYLYETNQIYRFIWQLQSCLIPQNGFFLMPAKICSALGIFNCSCRNIAFIANEDSFLKWKDLGIFQVLS